MNIIVNELNMIIMIIIVNELNMIIIMIKFEIEIYNLLVIVIASKSAIYK